MSRRIGRKKGELDGHKTLVTYSDRFRGHPGLIILDATAKLLPQPNAGKNFVVYEAPVVNYSNLCTFHVEQSDKFRGISSRIASEEIVRAFAQWVRETVQANSSVGEADVVSLNQFTTDIQAFMRCGDIRKTFFDGPFPVTTTLEVSSLYDPRLLVEINGIAEVPTERFLMPQAAREMHG